MAIGHSLSMCSLTDAPSSYHPYACLDRPLSLKKTQAFQSIRIRRACHEWSHFLCLSSCRASTGKTPNLIMYTKKSLISGSMFQYLKKIQRVSLIYCKYSFYYYILKFQECVAGFPEVKRWFRSFVGVLVILSVSVAVNNNLSYALTEENLLFLEAWRTLDRAYYDKTFNGTGWFLYREKALREEPMNTRKETYTAIKKMIKELDDPFTRFLEPEKFKSLRSGTQGALTGVGLSIGYPKETNEPSAGLVVVAATPGGPANRAGILPGDIILAIDNERTDNMGIYDAADHLQGPEGSLVKLTIRSSPSEVKTISLERKKVTLNPVTSRMCEVSSLEKKSKRIGYIKLTSFNQNASGAVKDAIESLRKDKVDAFVLDLRNNSGGLFPEGIEVAKIWMQKGVIVYICDSRGVRDIYEADGNRAVATSEPLAVLVNKGTASASEILAGALKDNNRAVLYGEPTYGKGKIQSVFELSDGSGLAVTVARYETPSHIDIDKVGVMPDHPLPAAFPLDEDEVCSCIDNTTSSCSLDRAKLFSK